MNLTWKTLAVAALVASAPALAGQASAQSAGAPNAQNVQWRGGGWHGGWRGGGWGPGAVAGGIVGGAVAAATSPFWAGDYDSGPGYAYDYGPGYSDYGYSDYDYAPGPGYGGGGYGGGGGGGSVAYCAQRFRSYDPASGTYMGYDGIRHSCP
jgi:hypothetical protein